MPLAKKKGKAGPVIAAPMEKPKIAVMRLTTGAASVEYDLHADW